VIPKTQEADCQSSSEDSADELLEWVKVIIQCRTESPRGKSPRVSASACNLIIDGSVVLDAAPDEDSSQGTGTVTQINTTTSRPKSFMTRTTSQSIDAVASSQTSPAPNSQHQILVLPRGVTLLKVELNREALLQPHCKTLLLPRGNTILQVELNRKALLHPHRKTLLCCNAILLQNQIIMLLLGAALLQPELNHEALL
jgi:hypothetical protein